MRAVVVDTFGSPDVLQIKQLPDPEPPPGGYVVQVMAAGRELRGRRRATRPLQEGPAAARASMGKEAAGVVVARDPDAVEFDVGDPVIVVRFANGCYADQVAAEAHEVLRPPRGLVVRRDGGVRHQPSRPRGGRCTRSPGSAPANPR